MSHYCDKWLKGSITLAGQEITYDNSRQCIATGESDCALCQWFSTLTDEEQTAYKRAAWNYCARPKQAVGLRDVGRAK